ncbi:MAG: YHS domain-containing protein [Chloroflexi bacterium]|nr:YHS domain-containing protein [Chloroflexota bacterium]
MTFSSKQDRLVRDPICGMRLSNDQIVVDYTYYGVTYAFCSYECREQFSRAAELYVAHMAHEPDWYLGHSCPHEGSLSGP